jgi:HK97 family phage portal protein
MLLDALRGRRKTHKRSTFTDVLNERLLISNGQIVTAAQSQQSVAVFASANFIASTNSQLPIDLFRGDGADKRQLPKSPLLTDPAGDGYGFSDWAWNVFYRTLIEGNAVGLIADRDSLGYPTTIVLKDLNRVQVGYDGNGYVRWHIDGKDVPTDRVFHFRAYPQEGKIMGLSPIGLHMRTVGIGINAEEFGSRFFSDGGHPTAILTSDAKLDKTQAALVKSRFLDAIRGSREPVVLPNDIKYQPIQINPQESQFLETQRYSAAQCARIFGPGVAEMLGYETGNALTYANVESRSLHVLIYTLNSWLRRLEAALSSQKMTPRGQYVRFNREALLQATTLDRYRAYEIALKNRWQTVNEVREIEDYGPVSWGNEPNPATPATTPQGIPGGTQ